MRNPKKLGWLAGWGAAGAAGRSWWRGLRSPQGAAGEAVRGSQADPVVWVAGQGCLW